MLEISLTYSTSEGSKEIPIDRERTSFGRGDADYRLDDEGLSRVHASVHRDGGNLWIVDENSTNGSFVNGERVGGGGAILKNGDVIKIGNQTTLTVKIAAAEIAAAPNVAATPREKISVANGAKSSFLIPAIITMVALFVIGIAAVIVGVKAVGGKSSEVVYQSKETADGENSSYQSDDELPPTPEKTPRAEKTTAVNTNAANPANTTVTPETLNSGATVTLPANKKYQAMSDDEKNKYIAAKSEKIARIIGNQKSEAIPPEAVAEIKKYLNGYVSRLAKTRTDDCTQGGWVRSDFNTVLERAAKNSPFIVRAFNSESIEPQIGIYIAMIESEHCPCLESPTHAKGLFQFLASSAPDYGLSADARCEPEPAAKAAAKYVKSLMGRFGTAPDSVPLSIASYNSGQGNLSKNLDKVFAAVAGQDRNFWTLTANQNKMEGGAAKQFSGENVKYVPKFFATAIIGENPQDFGANVQPLSSYTK